MNTKILRKLSVDEIQTLKSELFSQPEERWTNHTRTNKGTALHEGKTIHIIPVPTKTPGVVWGEDKRCFFTETTKLVSLIIGDTILNRFYWHRLPPGTRIEKHNDSILPSVRSEWFLKRYQFYLDIPSGVEIIFDDVPQQVANYENTLVDFDLREDHEYYNGSNQTLYLMVFDAMKKEAADKYLI